MMSEDFGWDFGWDFLFFRSINEGGSIIFEEKMGKINR
jgi:hypothetical protein